MEAYSALLIGCGAMGSFQGEILSKLEGLTLRAVCDRDAQAAQNLAAKLGVSAETDAEAALITHRPHLVGIATGNSSHCALVCLAARHGARAIYVEKPIAVTGAEMQRMRAVCAEQQTLLVVGHQRRLGADLIAMRETLQSGALGRLRRVIVQCAGDLLSDGTHLLDTVDYLLDGQQPEWVQASLHRADPTQAAAPKQPGQDRAPGWRFGHPVENGLVATLRYPGGVVVEVRCGDAVEPYVAYQSYELQGTAGHIWRPGDPGPKFPTGNVFIQDGQPGDHAATWNDSDWPFRPLPQAGGSWRPLRQGAACTTKMNLIGEAYQLLVHSLRSGAPHPMEASVGERPTALALRIYEAAVSGKRVRGDDPVPQDFPLSRISEAAPLCSAAV